MQIDFLRINIEAIGEFVLKCCRHRKCGQRRRQEEPHKENGHCPSVKLVSFVRILMSQSGSTLRTYACVGPNKIHVVSKVFPTDTSNIDKYSVRMLSIYASFQWICVAFYIAASTELWYTRAPEPSHVCECVWTHARARSRLNKKKTICLCLANHYPCRYKCSTAAEPQPKLHRIVSIIIIMFVAPYSRTVGHILHLLRSSSMSQHFVGESPNPKPNF